MDLRTDRRGVLLAQFAISRDMGFARLDGLTDAELFREPVPGCRSPRRRVEAVSPMACGAGERVVDVPRPEPEPPPFGTVAWRLGHLPRGWSCGGSGPSAAGRARGATSSSRARPRGCSPP